MITPTPDAFRAQATPGALIPVYKRILADLETPVSAYMKISAGQPYAFLFESVEKADRIGQHSFLGAGPATVFRAKGRQISLTQQGQTRDYEHDNPLEELRTLMRSFQALPASGLPYFQGGAVGYLSYDQVRFFEKLPDANPDALGLPDLYWLLTDTLLIFDHANNTISIVAHAHVEDDADVAYAAAVAKIDTLEAKLRAPLALQVPAPSATPDATLAANVTREEYCQAVRQAKEYIAAGDIFQVVLSQRFSRPVSASPLTLYRALRCINPSPYMLLMQFPEFALVGSSPEVMTQVKDRRAMVRPIAGTRPRGATPEEDLAYERDLLADEKELAEHIMLVDLGRNDIGRISVAGTVAPVDGKLMVIERYSHVMHIVSEVAGRLRPDCDAFDALAATFPMGTVSGAPKIRAMQIIDELENVRRGPYSGGCGYIGYNGEMDTCILIRTMVVKDGTAYLQAGAGIVYDSDPEREYEECVNKAKALVRAIEFAERGLEP